MSDFSRDRESVKRFESARKATVQQQNSDEPSSDHVGLRQRFAEAVPEFFRVMNEYRGTAPERTVSRRIGRVVTLAGLAVVSVVALKECDSIERTLTFKSGTAQEQPQHEAETPVKCTSVVVQPGDNMWVIARRHQPEGDLRELVGSLKEQQEGISTTIHPGDKFRVCVPEQPDTERAGS